MYTTKMKERVVGVDIGLELTTYAIVDLRGNIVARDHFPTEDYATISSYVSKLAESIMFLAETNGGYETIRSVGISCPSANFKTGCIENAPNMPWKGVIPLAALLRDRLGLAVAVGNDCHIMALGEHAFGCDQGYDGGCGPGRCYYGTKCGAGGELFRKKGWPRHVQGASVGLRLSRNHQMEFGKYEA